MRYDIERVKIRRAVTDTASLLVASLLMGLACGSVLVGCPWLRGAVMDVTPGVPSRTDSDAAVGASRCNGAVPEVRSESGRWWPATPAGAPCPYGCATDADGGAYCTGRDGGAE